MKPSGFFFDYSVMLWLVIMTEIRNPPLLGINSRIPVFQNYSQTCLLFLSLYIFYKKKILRTHVVRSGKNVAHLLSICVENAKSQEKKNHTFIKKIS